MMPSTALRYMLSRRTEEAHEHGRGPVCGHARTCCCTRCRTPCTTRHSCEQLPTFTTYVLRLAPADEPPAQETNEAAHDDDRGDGDPRDRTRGEVGITTASSAIPRGSRGQPGAADGQVIAMHRPIYALAVRAAQPGQEMHPGHAEVLSSAC